jgi:hypothetical protein
MIIIGIFLIIAWAIIAAAPMTWLLMLFAGNVGFAQFGFWDVLPGGLILAALCSPSKDD